MDQPPQENPFIPPIEVELQKLSFRSVGAKGLSFEELHADYKKDPLFEISLVSDISLSTIERTKPDGSKEAFIVDLFLKPGDPPKLYITFVFLHRTLLTKTQRGVREFRRKLEYALERRKDVLRTLANNVSPSLALILRKDKKRWLRTKLDVVDVLPWDDFEIKYSATVIEKRTGIEHTVHYDRDMKAQALETARYRVSQIIFANEEFANFRAQVREMQKDTEKIPITKVPAQKIEKITVLSYEDGKMEEIKEYGLDQDK